MKKLKLKEFRESSNLTQEQMANIMGVTQSGYSLWENGKRFPNYQQIVKLCEIFDCTPNDLFGIHGAMSVAIDPLFEEYKALRDKIKK